MAGRKKAAKRKKPEETPASEPSTPLVAGPETRGGMIYFSKNDLQAYELLRSKYEAAMYLSENISLKIDKEKRDHLTRLEAMNNDKFSAIRESEKAKAELVPLEKAIAEKYGINLSKITYDPKTGLIKQPAT